MHSSFAHAVQLNVCDPWGYVPHVIPELPANKMLLSCMRLDTSWVASKFGICSKTLLTAYPASTHCISWYAQQLQIIMMLTPQ